MVRPQVKPHVDNPALGDSIAFMRGGAKPHTTRISQDVLASVTNRLLSAKNPDICIIANLWLIMSRNIIGTNPLPQIVAGLRTGKHTTINGQHHLWTSLRYQGGHVNHQQTAEYFFLSYDCLCVKFILRLVHSFYGLVHVKKAMLKGNSSNICI